MKTIPKLYTLAETAEILHVTRQTLYNWKRAGRLSVVRVNGKPRIAEFELMRLIQREKCD